MTTSEGADANRLTPIKIGAKFKLKPNHCPNDEFKYRKKTYHISVRNKISPHILKLENNTNKNFDKKVHLNDR